MSQFGSVVNEEVICDMDGKSRGFVFVDLIDHDARPESDRPARRILVFLWDGRKVSVCRGEPKQGRA